MIKLCLSEDCQKLVVSHVNLEHNHVGKVSVTYRHGKQNPAYIAIPMGIYSEVGVGNRWRMSYLKQVFGEKNATVQDCSCEVCAYVIHGYVVSNVAYHLHT